MTDNIPLRKTLSLKRKRKNVSKDSKISSTSFQQSGNNISHHNCYYSQKLKQDNHQNRKVSYSDKYSEKKFFLSNSVNTLAQVDPVLEDLQKKREILLKKIKIFEQRLLFISSEPLRNSCYELKKEDIKLLCQINDHLMKDFL